MLGAYELQLGPQQAPRLLSLSASGNGSLDGAWRWWGALRQGPARWLLALWSPQSWPSLAAPSECLLVYRRAGRWRWRALPGGEERSAARHAASPPWSPAHPRGLIGRWQTTGSAGTLTLSLARAGHATITLRTRPPQAGDEEPRALQGLLDQRQLYWWGDHQHAYLLSRSGGRPLTLSWEAGTPPQLRLPLPLSVAEPNAAEPSAAEPSAIEHSAAALSASLLQSALIKVAP